MIFFTILAEQILKTLKRNCYETDNKPLDCNIVVVSVLWTILLVVKCCVAQEDNKKINLYMIPEIESWPALCWLCLAPLNFHTRSIARTPSHCEAAAEQQRGPSDNDSSYESWKWESIICLRQQIALQLSSLSCCAITSESALSLPVSCRWSAISLSTPPSPHCRRGNAWLRHCGYAEISWFFFPPLLLNVSCI